MLVRFMLPVFVLWAALLSVIYDILCRCILCWLIQNRYIHTLHFVSLHWGWVRVGHDEATQPLSQNWYYPLVYWAFLLPCSLQICVGCSLFVVVRDLKSAIIFSISEHWMYYHICFLPLRLHIPPRLGLCKVACFFMCLHLFWTLMLLSPVSVLLSALLSWAVAAVWLVT